MQDELFFAHTAADGRKQTVRAHLQETAELCAGYAADFGAVDQGLLLGLAHDIGKYSTKFQNRLNGDPQKVDHSTAGAYECAKMNQPFAAFAVAGHHSGLPDGGSRTDHPCESSFYARMNRAATGGIEAYSSWPGELPQADYPHITNQAEAMFYTRMLYSCLVDADFLNTEAFMDGQGRVTAASDMETLSKRFQEAINPWFPPKGELNRQRCAILKCCMAEGATQPTGMFTLTVPTGGGKTAASLAFALEHAKTHGLRRIIYVIPYTSIIEQTAEVFRKMLGAEFVLEHHSGVLYDTGSEATPETIHMGKATENWDMPIIVTTAVQFFESLFSNRPSRCRKLHNLSKSVIIFDEAQMLPLPYLRPCVWSVAQLVKQFGTSVVLCTATQPALDGMLKEFLPVDYPIRELCPSHLTNWNGFQRVSFRRGGVLSWKVLAQQMNQTKQVLCIVNSRKSAQELYELLNEEGAFHLSTLMVPAHRFAKLAEIRKRLKTGMPCRVVSTSLIEAGVDVDFPAVFREEAGMDSILQAAGRCNREGKRPRQDSIVTVFQSENPLPILFRMPTEISKSVMEHYEDFTSLEAIHAYFRELLELKGNEALDQKELLKLMNDNRMLFPFSTLAQRVQLIDSQSQTVYIPIEAGAELIGRLQSGERNRALFQKLGQYGVSVYAQHFAVLKGAGALEVLEDGSAILLNQKYYSEETGLSREPVEAALLIV